MRSFFEVNYSNLKKEVCFLRSEAWIIFVNGYQVSKRLTNTISTSGKSLCNFRAMFIKPLKGLPKVVNDLCISLACPVYDIRILKIKGSADCCKNGLFCFYRFPTVRFFDRKGEKAQNTLRSLFSIYPDSWWQWHRRPKSAVLTHPQIY